MEKSERENGGNGKENEGGGEGEGIEGRIIGMLEGRWGRGKLEGG